MKCLLALFGLGFAVAVAACTTKRNPDVCCTTDADCARLGGVEPIGCADGFVCSNFMCVAAACAADTDCTVAAPVCDLSTATCGACTSSGDCDGYADAPICDPASGACRGCRLDAECASDVCDVDTGRCVAEADIIYASATGSDAAACTRTNPCSTTRAIVVASADPSPSIVRMLPGTYGTPITVSSGIVTLSGAGAVLQPPIFGADALVITSGAHLTVRGLTLNLTLNNHIICDGTTARPTLNLRNLKLLTFQIGTILRNCFASMQQVELTSSADAVVYVDTGASLEVDRVLFRTMGVYASGKRLTIRITNSIFDDGQIGFDAQDDMTSESRMSLAFNTLFSRTNGVVGCSATGNMIAIVENNVITAPIALDSISGSKCTVANNVVFPQSTLLPNSNSIVDPMLVNPAGHDLRLQAGSPAIDAAVPSATLTSKHDFFGVARPQGPRLDIGAHEYVP